MRFQKEINIFARDSILKRFQANETNFSVLQGKIESLISESEITELQNSKVTMYSKLANVTLRVDGLTQKYTDLDTKYDSVSNQYASLNAKVADYKSSVDGFSANLLQLSSNLSKNYSTTSAMNLAINAKVDSLSSEMSKTYATGEDVKAKLAAADATAKGYADAAKQAAINAAKASTDELLKSYATVSQMQSSIQQKADSITNTVSATYATKASVASLESWKKEASQKITDSSIISTVTSSAAWSDKAASSRVDSLETRVSQTEKDITTKVSKGSVASTINQTAQSVKIDASKIKFEGLVTANKGFEIDENGSITATTGNIGSWAIKNGYIISKDENIAMYGGKNPYIKIGLSRIKANGNAAVIDNGLWIYTGDEEFSDGTDMFRIFNLIAKSGKTLVIDSYKSVGTMASSSKRYKIPDGTVAVEDAYKILDIPVVQFKYKEGYLSKKDELCGKSIPGFYAEQVNDILPIAAIHDEEGKAEDWNYRILFPLVIRILQDTNKRIEELERRLKEC